MSLHSIASEPSVVRIAARYSVRNKSRARLIYSQLMKCVVPAFVALCASCASPPTPQTLLVPAPNASTEQEPGGHEQPRSALSVTSVVSSTPVFDPLGWMPPPTTSASAAPPDPATIPPPLPTSLGSAVFSSSPPTCKLLEPRLSGLSFGPGRVRNGTVCDRAIIPLPKGLVLVVPNDAVVAMGRNPSSITVIMAKGLSFYGHPPVLMSGISLRGNMGVAIRTQDNHLFLSTYGEWDSHMEGGVTMNLGILVPAGVEVKTAVGLSGERAVASWWPPDKWEASQRGMVEYWYGPVRPGPGWTRIAAAPAQ